MPCSLPAIQYLTPKELIDLHDHAIEKTGGFPGVKDEQHFGLLDSTLAHIKNDGYYPSLPEKLTHLSFSIAKNHYLGLSDREHFRKSILKPLLDAGLLHYTIPDKPTSPNQKFVTVKQRGNL